SGSYLRSIWINRGAGAMPGGIGSAWDLDFSPDSAEAQIYNTNGWNEVMSTIDRENGTVLAKFGRAGHMAGEFTYMHTIASDSRGNLYIGETVGGRRVQKLVPAG